MQTEALTFEQTNLFEELKRQIEAKDIDAETAKYIQDKITEGDITTAETALEGIKAQATATVDIAKEQRAGAKEIAEIDEAMQTEALTFQQTNLFEELKREIEAKEIDAATAKYIQDKISEGSLEEARQQLAYAREIAAGQVTIGDEQVPTIEAGRFNLEEALTQAQLEQLVKTEQGQSIANFMALVQTLDPESVARGELEAKIAEEVQASIGDEALKSVLLEMLRPIDLGGEEETGDL